VVGILLQDVHLPIVGRIGSGVRVGRGDLLVELARLDDDIEGLLLRDGQLICVFIGFHGTTNNRANAASTLTWLKGGRVGPLRLNCYTMRPEMAPDEA
jgi:hypothetical protein